MRTSPIAGVFSLALAFTLAAPTAAQTPAQPPAPTAKPAAPTTKPPAPAPAARRAAAKPRITRVIVRDFSGSPLEGVTVRVSGPQSSTVTTGADGAVELTLPDGMFRLRFEDERIITLEREVTMRAGQPATVEVALNRAPPPPEPVPAPPAPEAAEEAPAAVAVGPSSSIAIPTFLEKNYIGRDPLRESILGCTPDAMTRLLQLRDPLASHTHNSLDEILYVVAGEGSMNVGDQRTAVAAGSVTVIPRTLAHTIEPRGRNPLILLSVLAGAPCPPAAR
jgi:mannose-6-phosphate isomerase-like protein (cupin superfamily)